MELVRALALRPQTAWLAGLTAMGHRDCALPRPAPSPHNRTVEPKTEGQSDFSLWVQPSALLPSHTASRSPKGADGVAL
jgi:hypothetical protein